MARENFGVVKETAERLGQDYRLVRVRASVGNSINFRRVEPEALNMIYNACDLLLFPTLDEWFSYPAVEAFTTGLPVVTSDIDVMEEVCNNSAVLVEPTVDGCVRGVKEAPASREELSKRGLKAREYSFERFRDNYLRFYEDTRRSIVVLCFE